MKIWILRPINPLGGPWKPWYDKAFGFVIGAETEQEARAIAQKKGGNECGHDKSIQAWIDPSLSSCIEMTEPHQPGVILRDFAAA